MKKDRSLKQRLISALLVLVMMITSLLGTTFAWFTDEVTSAGNMIQSGTLKIDILHKVENNWVSVKENPEHKIFNHDKWEPGYTRVETLKAANLGTLALQYKLSLTVEEGTETLGANGENLADVIEVYASYGDNTEASYEKITRSTAWSYKGTLAEVMANPSRFMGGQLLPAGETLAADAASTTAVESQTISIALHMKESAGDEYQKLGVGNIYVNLVATQWSYEDDAFGSDYDNDALFPLTPGVLYYSSVSVTVDGEGKLENGVTIGGTNDISTAVIPEGVKLNEGATELALELSIVEEREAVVEMNGGDVAIPLDVHIEGISSENTVPVTVTISGVFPKNYAGYNIRLFHVENGSTVAMTPVESLGALDAHNEYYYDSATGVVTLSMATFSEVTAAVTADNAWNGTEVDTSWYNTTDTEFTLSDAADFAGFAQIVGGMAKGLDRDSFAGKTVKLGANINLGGSNGTIFTPVGYYFTDDADGDGTHNKDKADIYSDVYPFEGTFDGQGYTISNILQRTWDIKGDDKYYNLPDEQYYNDGMGIFGFVYNGTVKNLAVRAFESDGEFCTTGVVAAYSAGESTFENIRITECNPRAYNVPNGGVVGYAYDEAEAANNSITFKNVTVDPSTKISALWGSWDVGCGGILGRLGDNTKLTMTDCTVGAIIDVFNDVCANYQYYQYRYCGMLIGTVGSDGDTSDQEDNMTFENIQVYYGDWSQNYNYYCELVENSIASYTHDYQFSRLDMINSLYDITTDGESEWDVAGNFVLVKDGVATCYHIRENENGEFYQHKHEDSGNEVIDGQNVLVENNQCVHIPFKQFYAGYGWGADHTTDIANVTEAKYTITFMSANGDVLDVQYVTTDVAINVADYDDTAIKLLGAGYNFKTWTTVGAKEITAIDAGNTKNYVLYATEDGVYTARWVDFDGNVIYQETFEEGDTTLTGYPSTPEVEGYIVSWPSYTLGTSDITIMPMLTPENSDLGAAGFDSDGDGVADYYVIETIDTSSNPDVNVEIPAEVNGVPVVEVSSGAMSSFDDLTTVKIPTSITSIGADAFADEEAGGLLNMGHKYEQITIIYAGTKAQWDAINKDANWDQYVGNGSKIYFLADGTYSTLTADVSFIGEQTNKVWGTPVQGTPTTN